MLRLVQQLPRHIGVALVDGMEIRIAQLTGPMIIEAMLHLRLQPRDLGFADILEAVDHIGRNHPLPLIAYAGIEIHQIACEIGRHIVPDAVVKKVQPRHRRSRFPLYAYIKVKGFFRPQPRIAGPVIAQLAQIKADGHAGVHFPVVVELAHARFRIARADIGLEPPARLPPQHMGHAQVEGQRRAEQAAVIEAQYGRQRRVLIELPRILYEEMLLFYFGFTDSLPVFPLGVFFLKAVPFIGDRLLGINAALRVIMKNTGPLASVMRIFLAQEPRKFLPPRHGLGRNVTALSVRAVFQIVFPRVRRLKGISRFVAYPVQLVRFVIVRDPLAVGKQQIIVDPGGRFSFPALAVQVFIIIPGVDIPGIGLRRTFQTAAFARLSRIAEPVGQQMAVIDLRIGRRLDIQLLVDDVVQVGECVLPLIRRFSVIRRQRNVVFVHLRVIHVDLPVRTAAVIARVGQAVRVARQVAFKMCGSLPEFECFTYRSISSFVRSALNSIRCRAPRS